MKSLALLSMPKRTKLNPDHAQRHNTPTLDDEARGNQLEALLTPAIADQLSISGL